MAAIFLLISGCHADEPTTDEPKGVVYYSFFDTVSYVYNYAGDSDEKMQEVADEAVSVLERYNDLFDIYYEHSGINNLRTVNLNAGVQPVACDPELIAFLQYAIELYRLTEGRMNIMLGSVLRLWHDCRTEALHGGKAVLPSAAALEEAAKHISIDALVIDVEKGTVYITDPAASIDVGAVGKGYATEKAARHLEEIGAYGYVLNIGGNIRTVGSRPDGTGWSTGIRNPDGSGNYSLRVTLSDTSCVTSGDYERYYTVDGVRYHHIIDPETLQPARYFSSVTIITPDSGMADALSTAIFCMSYEDGLALISSLDSTEAVWIFTDGSVRYSDGVKNILVS